MIVNELQCATCLRLKPADQFYKDARSATRHKKDCKLCYNAKRATAVKREYDRKRKADRYADDTWRKAHNQKRKAKRLANKINTRMRATNFSSDARQ